MKKPEAHVVRSHEDPVLFREALNFTAAETGFVPRLIEKDYFCSLLLEHLTKTCQSLVFKGGTCLAKVHAEFYRLSEDVDFTIPLPSNASRSERSARAMDAKAALQSLLPLHQVFRIVQALTGANNSTQYIASVGYPSVLSHRDEIIKIEIGLREPMLTPVIVGSARTILLDPVSGGPLVESFPARCISRTEAFAEKFRAALSRRDVAIRDFFDIDYAERRLDLRHDDRELIELVRQKLSIPGNESVDVSEKRQKLLRQQLETELKPVLRARDFAEFDLERAIRTVSDMAGFLA